MPKNNTSVMRKAVSQLADVAASEIMESASGVTGKAQTIKGVISALEQEIMERVMEGTRGNQSLTAKLLGLSRSTVISRIKAMSTDRVNTSEEILDSVEGSSST